MSTNPVVNAQVFLTPEEAKSFAKPFRKPRVAGRSVRILNKHVVGFGAKLPVYMVVVTQAAVAEPVQPPVNIEVEPFEPTMAPA